jgi:hypothetical protein
LDDDEVPFSAAATDINNPCNKDSMVSFLELGHRVLLANPKSLISSLMEVRSNNVDQGVLLGSGNHKSARSLSVLKARHR